MVRLLPQELPRDEIHGAILDALRSGNYGVDDILPMFYTPAGFMSSMFYLTMHLHDYELAGRQTFVISRPMQEALAATSLSEIAPDEFQLPYDSMYVALPECGQVIWGGNRTKWHKVGGVFLQRIQGDHRMGKLHLEAVNAAHLNYENCDEVDAINVYIWGLENSESHGIGDDANFWLTIDFNEMREKGHKDLEAYLNFLFAEKTRDCSMAGVTDLGKALDLVVEMPQGESEQVVFKNVIDVLRIIFNAVLYLDSEGAEVEEDTTSVANHKRREDLELALSRMKNTKKGRGRRMRRELETLPRDQVVWVGRSVSSTESDPRETRAPGRETWVRGHWWPRRDTIRHRILTAREEVEAAQIAEAAVKAHVAALPVEETNAIADGIRKVAEAQSHAKATQDTADSLERDLEAKRRWVRPYKRNKGRGSPVESHTYMVGDDDERNVC